MRLILTLPLIALAGCSSTAFDRKLDGLFGIERADEAPEAVVVASEVASEGTKAKAAAGTIN